eukprot:SAG31_NODE_2176_length_6256_cov_1.835797_2_plen_123_part_00
MLRRSMEFSAEVVGRLEGQRGDITSDGLAFQNGSASNGQEDLFPLYDKLSSLSGMQHESLEWQPSTGTGLRQATAEEAVLAGERLGRLERMNIRMIWLAPDRCYALCIFVYAELAILGCKLY